MSRSKPTDNTPNPAAHWYRWDSANGTISYYDKEKEQDVDVGDNFTFILLDQLATVKGWDDSTESGIYSNEVRDTKSEPLTVKSFKGLEVIANGIYSQIKDKVKAAGGRFVSNLYIACKTPLGLEMSSLQFKGAALRAWSEFSKANRGVLYKKAVRINGSVEGQKGRVTFKIPKFQVVDISEETDVQAKVLDEQLQVFLDGYFKRKSDEQLTGEDAKQSLPRPVSTDTSWDALEEEANQEASRPGDDSDSILF